MFQKLEKCITIKVLGAPGGIAKENKITGMCSIAELKACRRPQVSFLGAVRQSLFLCCKCSPRCIHLSLKQGTTLSVKLKSKLQYKC